jgi:RNA polymerase sigma-70 factor (ECF subfamily)
MSREEELLIKIQQGDSGYLDELIALIYPEILRYCFWHTQNRQCAEDAVQETFLRVCKYFDWHAHPKKFKAFVYRVARNICIDQGRKRKAAPLEEETPYIEPQYAQIESSMDFERLIAHLTPEQQEIILLRFVYDLKLKDIAEITGLPVRTTQSRLRTALKQIEKNMDSRGEGI